VLIFSGSEMAKLEETFGGLPLWLAAENGVYVRPPVRPELPQVTTRTSGAAGSGSRSSSNCSNSSSSVQ
jgi:trehalose-6-phosphatase